MMINLQHINYYIIPIKIFSQPVDQPIKGTAVLYNTAINKDHAYDYITTIQILLNI